MTTLPPLFAVIDDNHSGSVIILECVRERDQYRIGSRCFFQQDALPSFLVEEREPGPVITDISLIVGPSGTRLYYGDGWATGSVVYTVYHPLPIPVLSFVDRLRRGSWPLNDNVLEIMVGNRMAVDFWRRRWDPRAVWDDLRSDGVRSSRVVETPTSTNSNPSPPLSSVPKFVTDLVIADAVARGATCPITMEVIETTKAAITPCFHVFEATALAAWTSRCDSSEKSCPVCKAVVDRPRDTNNGFTG